MPARDVVDKAKAKGIKLSLAQVYTARSTAKQSKRTADGLRVRTVATLPAKQPGSDSELQFRRLVLAIGLPKAEAYLSELKRSVGL